MTTEDIRIIRGAVREMQAEAEAVGGGPAAYGPADELSEELHYNVLLGIAEGEFSDPQHAAALAVGLADDDLG